MKILQLIQKPQNRGAEMFTCQLSNHLIDLGHQVKIIALFEGVANLPFSGEITSLNASIKNRFFDISAWKKLADIVKDYNPDIIQANAGDTLKYAVFSKKLYGWTAPIIFRNASEVGRYLRSPFQKILNSFFYKNVSYVISVSQVSEKDILDHFPFLLGTTKVIPVGLETISKIEKFEFKPENHQHIVHVGGFSFEKNHKGLISIFQIVNEENPEVFLHLIGDGSLKFETEELVKKLGLENIIKFYGFVENPLDYIKAADVLVLPSIIEGLPGVLLEAMYCKIPVISYDVGGISEIVNSQTGTLIQKNNEKAFVKAILHNLERPNQDYIENAYRMVTGNYLNKKLAEEFSKSYENIINNSK